MNKSKFASLLAGLGEAFGKEITPFVAEAYHRALSPLGEETITKAFYAAVERCRRFPTIVELKELVGISSDPLSGEDMARDAVARIGESVRRFGYCNPDRAKDYIGELGWRLVERLGGWEAVCNQRSEKDLTVLLAQARELGKVLLKAGDQPRGPELPPNHKAVRIALGASDE